VSTLVSTDCPLRRLYVYRLSQVSPYPLTPTHPSPPCTNNIVVTASDSKNPKMTTSSPTDGAPALERDQLEEEGLAGAATSAAEAVLPTTHGASSAKAMPTRTDGESALGADVELATTTHSSSESTEPGDDHASSPTNDKPKKKQPHSSAMFRKDKGWELLTVAGHRPDVGFRSPNCFYGPHSSINDVRRILDNNPELINHESNAGAWRSLAQFGATLHVNASCAALPDNLAMHTHTHTRTHPHTPTHPYGTHMQDTPTRTSADTRTGLTLQSKLQREPPNPDVRSLSPTTESRNISLYSLTELPKPLFTLTTQQGTRRWGQLLPLATWPSSRSSSRTEGQTWSRRIALAECHSRTACLQPHTQ
jgi:hypothetical protein